MNPSNPFEPRPGDWEAALKAIEAAEHRHDRWVRVRRWTGASAVAGLLLWGGWWLLQVDPVDEQGKVEAAGVEVEAVWKTDEVSTGAAFREGQVPEAIVAPDPAAEAPDLGTVSVPGPTEDEWKTASNPRNEGAAKRDSPSQASQKTRQVDGGRTLPLGASTQQGGFEPSTDAANPVARDEWHPSELPKLEPSELATVACASNLSRVSSRWDESLEGAKRSWGGYVGRSRSAWVAGVSWNGLSDPRMPAFRAGVLFDQQQRQWVAKPERNAFGAAQAARGIASDQAVWCAGGLDWSHHVKGRWGATASLEGQILLTRHMIPSSSTTSEVLTPVSPAVWGTLEEEHRARLRWAMGVDWAGTERQRIRFELGGHWAPQPAAAYLDFTSGSPMPIGEFRLTWFWI